MPDLSDWKILIVDDEPDNVGVLELVFQFHKAIVWTAESGQRCLEMLEGQLPSVLLVDIQMPVMTGYDLLKIIRADARWSHLPVIGVSAHAMSGDTERAMEAGFDGYITKPITALTLADDVKRIVDAKGEKQKINGGSSLVRHTDS
ncbi:MAG: response regulator [Anaerolineae bacterium]|nr:response regulator [Anaerolineae bacterium]